MFGLLTFAFLVVRAYSASFAALRMLRGCAQARARPRRSASPTAGADYSSCPPSDRSILDINAKGMIAAMVGWTVCAFFASVAFNWTFYYVLALAVAGREIVASRRARGAGEPRRRRPLPRCHEPADTGAQLSLRRRTRSWSTRARRCTTRCLRRSTRAMAADDRVRFYFVASEEPAQAASIFRDAGPDARLIGPARGRADEVRRLPDVRLHVDAAASTAPAGSRCSTASAASYGFDAPDRVVARVAPAVLRQPAAAEQLHRVGRARRGQPGDPPDRHAEGRLPSSTDRSAATAVLASLGLAAGSADRALRADLVARIVAQHAGRGAAAAPAAAAGERAS